MVNRAPCRRHQQRGAASVVIAILFLVIAGYAAVAALEMSAATVTDVTLDDSGVRAQFLAESGLERGFQRFKTANVACASLGPEAYFTLGGGQFRVVSGALSPPGGVNCRITAEGRVGNALRKASAVAMPGNFQFLEPFPSNSDFTTNWTASIVGSSRGGHGFISNNCNTCAGATGGALQFSTRAGGNNDRYRGYVQRTINSLNSRSGITVQVSLGYWKAAANNRADNQTVSVYLISSATGSSVTLWSHTAISNAQTWVFVNQTATLPANQNYDRLRVEVDLREDGNRTIEVRVDEIKIAYP